MFCTKLLKLLKKTWYSHEHDMIVSRAYQLEDVSIYFMIETKIS